MDLQRQHGQFFTVHRAFASPAFRQWLALGSFEPGAPALEPFAGACNIPLQLAQDGLPFQWTCYDRAPPSTVVSPACTVLTRDVLADFPQGHRLAITNPPYLAKNSARRRQLDFPVTSYEDLYQLALDRMLAQVPFVAAILPESFLTQGLFLDRLWATVSLKDRLFEDTACPVCLALFVPADLKAGRDFAIWDNQVYLGTRDHFEAILAVPQACQPWTFNVPQGEIALLGYDDQNGPTIAFAPGEAVAPSEVKGSSRLRTRIVNPTSLPSTAIIEAANTLLAQWRTATHDALMTPFKGVRRDGAWRRRLDYTRARAFLNLAVEQLS